MLHAGSVPNSDLATWDFRVFGEVESAVTLSWDELQELPSTEIELDIHCVTRWSRFDARFRGVHWRELAGLVRPRPAGRYVVAHAEQGFQANVPLRALEDENALIAYEADGEPLTPDHGWPLRLVIPSKYFWKSAKWLRGIELVAHDQPGFWERSGLPQRCRLLEGRALRLLTRRFFFSFFCEKTFGVLAIVGGCRHRRCDAAPGASLTPLVLVLLGAAVVGWSLSTLSAPVWRALAATKPTGFNKPFAFSRRPLALDAFANLPDSRAPRAKPAIDRRRFVRLGGLCSASKTEIGTTAALELAPGTAGWRRRVSWAL